MVEFHRLRSPRYERASFIPISEASSALPCGLALSFLSPYSELLLHGGVVWLLEKLGFVAPFLFPDDYRLQREA